MKERQVKPLPKPTKKLYRFHEFSSYHDGRINEAPEPVDRSFSELFLDPEKACIVYIRANLKVDRIARMMRDIHAIPMCHGAMNYASIWNRKATYFCDESGGGKPGDPNTWVWYKIDNSIPNNKVVQKIDPKKVREHLTFSEADKISSDWFFFDGSFTDLFKALSKEGFTIINN